ncbi:MULTISPECIES: hypothetical protein [unclassified Streptomyces]|uniref:hypothetical protein n=1 Tax=unclassified Streptomyces TaxID=2593676 RepID=UPI002024E6CA|nr:MULTISPECIES: hypothetical protein [unclassified Streptomyces]MCX4550555.1 hypothetical protein [Streptomyces sp. NBC_01500]WSC22002.1 hypothetical protein OIE60_21240 [Streptomyces sp. NBC_01766]
MDLRPRTLIRAFKDGVAEAKASDAKTGTDETMPDPPAAPKPRGLRIGDRPRAWWEPKPVITTEPVEDEAKPKADGEPCDHPMPHAVHSRPTGELVAYWCEDCETQLPVPEDDEDDEDEEEGGGVPARIRRLWKSRDASKKTYSRPAFGSGKSPKQSLAEWWGGMRPSTRHGLYNGSALAIGLWAGIVQFFTNETAYLVATYDSWTALGVCFWYGVALAIWMVDHKFRGWFPPFALLARVPLVSMIVGSLLYSTA